MFKKKRLLFLPWTSANSCHLYNSSASCLEKFKESQMIVIRSHWQTFLELSGPDQWCSGGGDACKNRWKWSLAHTLKGEITLSNGNVETFSIWLSIIIQWFFLFLIFDFWAVIYNSRLFPIATAVILYWSVLLLFVIIIFAFSQNFF